MEVIRKVAVYILILVSVAVIVLSLLSLIHDLRYWYYKVLDFPRLQYLIVASLCLVLLLLLNNRIKLASIFLYTGLVAAIAIQAVRIIPYWLGEKSVPDAIEEDLLQKESVSILLANVLVTNRTSEELLDIIEETDPDMILAMEVDEWWVEQLKILKEGYPHTIEYPLDNAYGMALYSRLPLREKEVMFLKHKDVPSFHAAVSLASGDSFEFHGVHPVAPVPSEKYPDNVGEEEVALLKVGEMVSKDSLPSIVAGDFNDVSWSNTSMLFEEEGGLKNVRLGRGLFNSFNAKSKILRWPLDHFFVTKEFALVRLERLPKFNSDHFPMLATFVLE